MAEGVGNPVYDSFNEGQPLEDVSDVKYCDCQGLKYKPLFYLCENLHSWSHEAWAGKEPDGKHAQKIC